MSDSFEVPRKEMEDVRVKLNDLKSLFCGIDLKLQIVCETIKELQERNSSLMRESQALQIWQALTTEQLKTGVSRFNDMQKQIDQNKMVTDEVCEELAEKYIEQRVKMAYVIGAASVAGGGAGLLIKFLGG